MRSTNGSGTTLFRLSIIIFFACSLFSEEYYISYRSIVAESTLYKEEFFVSKAMQQCKGELQRTSLVLGYQDDQNLKDVLVSNFDDFFDYLQKIGLTINAKTATNSTKISDKIALTFRSTCFKVDFNDNFVTITAIKEDR